MQIREDDLWAQDQPNLGSEGVWLMSTCGLCAQSKESQAGEGFRPTCKPRHTPSHMAGRSCPITSFLEPARPASSCSDLGVSLMPVAPRSRSLWAEPTAAAWRMRKQRAACFDTTSCSDLSWPREDPRVGKTSLNGPNSLLSI